MESLQEKYKLKQKDAVIFYLLNWDKEADLDFRTGKGFEITEPPYAKSMKREKKSEEKERRKHKDKNYNGIMSERFCSDWGDKFSFSERYTCSCKKKKGKKYEGEICNNCFTKVTYRDVDYKVFGWISLGRFKIVQPGYYQLLQSLIGEDELKSIINTNIDVDLNGTIIQESSGSSPFVNKGLIFLRENLEEIIKYYMNKNKNKASTAHLLLCNMDDIFASYIPVYNSVLRPEATNAENYFYHDANSQYQTIYSLSNLLKEDDVVVDNLMNEYDSDKILYKVQMKVNGIYEYILDIISGKKGFIKQNITGGRLSWSSRCVIIPDPTLRADQIELPYIAFLEMYKFQIIGYIKAIKKVTTKKAARIWHLATLEFDRSVYEIMNHIIEVDKPAVLINRNPTIKEGSMVPVYVRSITDDINDKNMRMPIFLLTDFNADFDGDVLNIFALITQRLIDEYMENGNPRMNNFISRSTGLFNKTRDLLKDQSIGLYRFNNI